MLIVKGIILNKCIDITHCKTASSSFKWADGYFASSGVTRYMKDSKDPFTVTCPAWERDSMSTWTMKSHMQLLLFANLYVYCFEQMHA